MTEVIVELDPGLEIRSRAEEQGLYVAYHGIQRSIDHNVLPDTCLTTSDVICAPLEGEIFEPAQLTEILASVVPTGMGSFFVEHTQPARFENPTWLRLPKAEIARRIGTYSLRAEVDINGEEPRLMHDVKELFAQSRVMMAPTRRYAEDMAGLRIDFVTLSMLDRGTPERHAFRAAMKNNFSWWDRFTAH